MNTKFAVSLALIVFVLLTVNIIAFGLYFGDSSHTPQNQLTAVVSKEQNSQAIIDKKNVSAQNTAPQQNSSGTSLNNPPSSSAGSPSSASTTTAPAAASQSSVSRRTTRAS